MLRSIRMYLLIRSTGPNLNLKSTSESLEAPFHLIHIMPSLASLPQNSVSSIATAYDDMRDMIVFYVIVSSIMSISVAIRVYTRAVIKKYFGLDDCTLLCSCFPEIIVLTDSRSLVTIVG